MLSKKKGEKERHLTDFEADLWLWPGPGQGRISQSLLHNFSIAVKKETSYLVHAPDL